MKICKVEYRDFVIWRENELIVLRIEKDELFLEEAMDKANDFFKYGILPELLANWYTKLQSSSQVPEQAECVKFSNTTALCSSLGSLGHIVNGKKKHLRKVEQFT